jgi:hypothetical protein
MLWMIVAHSRLSLLLENMRYPEAGWRRNSKIECLTTLDLNYNLRSIELLIARSPSVRGSPTDDMTMQRHPSCRYM